MALSVAGSSHCRGELRCVCVSTRVHAPCWYKLALPLTLLSVFFFIFFSRKYKEGGKKASVLVPTVHLVKSEHTTPTRQRWAATPSSILQLLCLRFWDRARLIRQEGKCRCLRLLPPGPPSFPPFLLLLLQHWGMQIHIDRESVQEKQNPKKTIYGNRRKLNSVKQNYRERAK